MSAAERSALLRWLTVWILLANVGFAMMYLIGSPPRFTEIMLFAIVGLVVRNRTYAVQCFGFVAAMAYSLLSFVAGLFNLSLRSLASSVEFFAELNICQSSEYLAALTVVLGLVAAALILMRRSTNFVSSKATFVSLTSLALMVTVDVFFSYGMRGHYNRDAAEGAPFSSAIQQVDVIPTSGQLERNLLVVMVESLGVPVENAEMDRLLFLRFRDPAVRSRFEVSSGTTTYFSSTTAAEIRELCGRWGDYSDLVSSTDNSCLPARLAAQGVETSAYHSFDGEFFDRASWYPNIGFDNMFFREELVQGGSERCGGVFPGVCDRDVPSQLAARLRTGSKPQFVYWLTVNSHLPVPPGNNLDVDDCAHLSASLSEEFPMICRQFAIWDAVDAALVREILAPDFPPTDILIVGDHMPPYFDRHNRLQFAPDRVPWLLLKWRGSLDKS